MHEKLFYAAQSSSTLKGVRNCYMLLQGFALRNHRNKKHHHVEMSFFLQGYNLRLALLLTLLLRNVCTAAATTRTVTTLPTTAAAATMRRTVYVCCVRLTVNRRKNPSLSKTDGGRGRRTRTLGQCCTWTTSRSHAGIGTSERKREDS